MKYRILYQVGEEVTEVHSEVDADGPREALDQVECEGLTEAWGFRENEDGSAAYVDPEDDQRLYSAAPLWLECAACGAEIPTEEAGVTPAADDDAEWGRLAFQHFDACEWVRTRGNQTVS